MQKMKPLFRLALVIPLFIQVSCDNKTSGNKDLNPSMVLWYDNPADNWTEALPVGNGRLGAMVYGGTVNETIQFNEETLWTGQPHDYAHEGAHEVLDELRQLLWDGKQDEATDLATNGLCLRPFGQLCYQPFGNVYSIFPDMKMLQITNEN